MGSGIDQVEGSTLDLERWKKQKDQVGVLSGKGQQKVGKCILKHLFFSLIVTLKVENKKNHTVTVTFVGNR